MINNLMFDLFGTILNLSLVPRTEIKAYVDQIRRPMWQPLVLPDHWLDLPVFEDVIPALRLWKGKTTVCSNAPAAFAKEISQRAGLHFDHYPDLEDIQKYKPDSLCYAYAASFGPSRPLMVTANQFFGDVEGAGRASIPAVVIRNPVFPDLISLVRHLCDL